MTRSMKFGSLAGALALLVVAQGCTEKKPADTAAMDSAPAMAATPPAPPAELTARGTAMVAAWNQDDPAVVAEFFTDSATVVVDDSTYHGMADIRDRWVKPGLPLLSNLTVTDQQYSGSGSMITETGKFSETMTMPKKEPVQNGGTYTITWTNDNGAWKASDMKVHADSTMAAPKS